MKLVMIAEYMGVTCNVYGTSSNEMTCHISKLILNILIKIIGVSIVFFLFPFHLFHCALLSLSRYKWKIVS